MLTLKEDVGFIKILSVFFLLIVSFGIGGSFYLHKDLDKKPYYVTSEACKGCHEVYYNSWRENTLHPWQFRPVKSDADIKGDFTSKDPALTFKKEDVQFVVGNKWEQIYVTMIEGEYYPLPAVWYISTNKWAPYKVDEWKKSPMSQKCNGCHTTGFDPETFKFTEFGIGCEACHGPGSVHLFNQKENSSLLCRICHRRKKPYQHDIITSVNASVCGQCHNRGNNISSSEALNNKFDFPINYSPGDDNIEKYFNQMPPEKDKDKKFWWGNGLSKNRHQEFADWMQSKHSQSLKLLKEKYTEDRGKLTKECLRCHSTDYRFAKNGEEPDLSSAKYGVTCIPCHEPHGLDKKKRFQKDGSYQCSGCHIGSFIKTIASNMKTHDLHPPGIVSCADCHMPYTVKSGGDFTIRSHAFKIILPFDTQKDKVPNSCQNGKCHKDKSIEWAIEEIKKFYPKSIENKS